MRRSLPGFAILLGLAGLLPFLGCALVALRPEAVADGDIFANRGAFALVAYGAVILAFLGGVHWGFALVDSAPYADRFRFGLGVVPSLIGWVALLFAVAIDVDAALGLLLLGFIATTAVESRAAAAGLMPRGYLVLRYVLSGTVVMILVLVIGLRLAGAHMALW